MKVKKYLLNKLAKKAYKEALESTSAVSFKGIFQSKIPEKVKERANTSSK